MDYIIFDAEYLFDREGHALYQKSERFDPNGIERVRENDPRSSPRWVFKRPVCISWLRLQVEDGQVSLGQLQTVGQPEMDEKTLLAEFFKQVDQLSPSAMLVTWGGASSDLPQLRAAGLRAGVRVPSRLSVPLTPGVRHGHSHIDLMTNYCGDASRVHLSEICSALRIPVKVTAPPDAVGQLAERGRWSLVKSICENDVLSTSALLIHALVNQQHCGTLFAGLHAIAKLGQSQSWRDYSAEFGDWSQALFEAEVANGFAAHALATAA